MHKIIVQLVFSFLFTGIIWGLGENPHRDDKLIKYLVFASQLLYGNFCYDVLKNLRNIPSDDKFWSTATIIAGEAFIVLIISFGLLVMAFNAPSFSSTGLAGALFSCVFVLYRVIPKLQPAYIQSVSINSNQKL